MSETPSQSLWIAVVTPNLTQQLWQLYPNPASQKQVIGQVQSSHQVRRSPGALTQVHLADELNSPE